MYNPTTTHSPFPTQKQLYDLKKKANINGKLFHWGPRNNKTKSLAHLESIRISLSTDVAQHIKKSKPLA